MLGSWALASAAERPGRDDVVRALLKRSRLLEDVRFTVPGSLYREYLRIASVGEAMFPAPVASIAGNGRYHLALDAAGRPALVATVALRVFKPRRCRNLPVLTAEWAWEKVAVNGAPASLAARKGWLRFTPRKAGRYVVSGQIGLSKGRADGGKVSFGIPRTVRTSLRFDSPGRWRVAVSGSPHRLLGQAPGGTHGELAVTPRERIEVEYTRPVELPPRPPRYELRGATAWNLDAGRQQIAARLRVRILGGRTDRLILQLPASARRVTITGPDVREAQVSPAGAAIFLRGTIAGQTRLTVGYELPLGAGSIQRLGRPELADGRWSGGTLAVTNTAGASEILPHAVRGLREIHPEDLPAEARGMLAGKCVLAYQITSRFFSAAVDVVDLGEFALRESIADLAHYRLLLRPDGSVLCKVDYEIRNRSRQFLRLHLPRGARVLVARVNDKPRPLTPLLDEPGAHLLPLVRSQASVKGLVSFPVQIVVLMRGKALRREGLAAVPLPRIDLPIAYGWCELHVPRDMAVDRWAGPMQHVERYSSETAVASLTYGRAELAEGYKLEDRPTVEAVPEGQPQRRPKRPPPPIALAKPPELKPTRPTEEPARPFGPATQPAATEILATKVTVPEGGTLILGGQVMLSRNYYRAGRDYYERGDYDKAAISLENTLRMAPKSAEAANAARLLANIKAVRGKLAAKSRQEKALTRQVKKEISGLNVKLEQQQRELIEQAGEAVRGGRRDEAAAGYQAAVSLGEQLIARGADEREQSVRLRDAKEELDRLQKQKQARATQLRTRYEVLKTAGQYGEALKIGKALQEVYEDKGEQQRLRGELEELAATTVRDKARHGATMAVQAATEVFTLEHAEARSVARVLSEMFAGRGQRGSAARSSRGPSTGRDQRVTITADETANALVLTAPPGQRDKIVELLQQLDAADSDANTERITAEGTSGFLPAAPRNIPALKLHASELREQKKHADALAVAGHVLRMAPADDWAKGEVKELQRILRSKDGRLAQLGLLDSASLRTPARRPDLRAVTKTYDVRDLVFGGGEAGRPSAGAGDDKPREKVAEDLVRTIRGALGREVVLGDAGIQISNGRLVVSATGGGQKLAADLFTRLRDIRGPQVEVGGNIAQQRAAGLVRAQRDVNGDGIDAPVAAAYRPKQLAEQREFQEFLRRNYDWEVEARRADGGWKYGRSMSSYLPALDSSGQARRSRDPAKVTHEIAGKLLMNVGQKVAVNSTNISLGSAAANALGIHFAEGRNDIRYAVVDEAQLRTLREMEARRPGEGRPVAANPRFQETIVGTDALLASGQVANVTFAGDRGNTIDIYSNPIALTHEKYVLIDNHDYLTAVQTGQMQHWTQRAKPLRFAEVPQDIEVPRVGRLVKLEKTLIKPADALTIRAEYTWTGKE